MIMGRKKLDWTNYASLKRVRLIKKCSMVIRLPSDHDADEDVSFDAITVE